MTRVSVCPKYALRATSYYFPVNQTEISPLGSKNPGSHPERDHSSFEIGDQGRVYSSTGESSTLTLEQIKDELLNRRNLNKKSSRSS